MPATVPLADIRAAIRERADMPLGDLNGVPRELVGDVELNRWINASHRALHDLILHAFGEDYFESQSLMTTLGTTDRLLLPHDFYKLLGLEMQISGGYPGRYATLHRVNRAERNKFVYPNAFPLGLGLGRALIGYGLYGAELRIVPPPTAGIVLRADYVPITPVLAESGSILWDPDDVDTLTFNGTVFPGTTTINDLSTAIAAMGYICSINSSTLTITPKTPDQKTVWKSSQVVNVALTPSTPCWMAYADEYNGWLEYVIVDCVRKAKLKEESDIGGELQELAELKERILNAAKDRDLGEPAQPVDLVGDGWGPNGTGWGY